MLDVERDTVVHTEQSSRMSYTGTLTPALSRRMGEGARLSAVLYAESLGGAEPWRRWKDG